jgi:uncharacterized membrane protein YdbT with pleckstrin-like domain
MSYIENNLMEDESLVHLTRLHPIILLSPAMAVSLLAGSLTLVQDLPIAQIIVLLLLLGAAFRLCDRLVFFVSSEFGITTKRVLGKTGFIQRRSLDIVLAKVEAIRLSQSIVGRLLNYGDIEVTGTGGTEEVLRFIPDPLLFRKVVQEQLAEIEGNNRADEERVRR